MAVENNWHPKIKEFVRHIRDHAASRNVRLYFSPRKYIKDASTPKGLLGYFIEPDSEDSGRIVVAYKHPMPTVIHTLAHEYAHFIQWEERMACYVKDHYIAQERNAEIRAIKLLYEFQIPIDLQVRERQALRYIAKLHRED